MAHVRCPSCHTKAPAAGEMFMRIPAPGTDSCPKCGADLLAPALEQLERRPELEEKTPEEIVKLGHTQRHTRVHALELRAQVHERMGQADQAERDRQQAIDELDQAIADQRDGDAMKRSAMLQWRGHVHEEAGRTVDAARDALRAVDVQEGTYSEGGVAFGALVGGSGWAAKAGAKHAMSQMVNAGRKQMAAGSRSTRPELRPGRARSRSRPHDQLAVAARVA